MTADDPHCTTTTTASTDSCKVTLNSSCINADGSASTTTEEVTWSHDGAHASGLETWTYSAAPSDTPCVSTVNITYSQL